MFKVEKGVEIVSKRRSKYAEFLKSLKPGDSFAKTEDGDPVTASHVASIRLAAKKEGIGIVTRRQEDGSFRVWRVEEVPVRKSRRGK